MKFAFHIGRALALLAEVPSSVLVFPVKRIRYQVEGKTLGLNDYKATPFQSRQHWVKWTSDLNRYKEAYYVVLRKGQIPVTLQILPDFRFHHLVPLTMLAGAVLCWCPTMASGPQVLHHWFRRL